MADVAYSLGSINSWEDAVKIFKRPPDMDIGPGYMHRWYVIPRNRLFNIYLHKIMKDDDDRALHDHPWWSISWMLKGCLIEVRKDGAKIITPSLIPVVRSAKFAHRLEVVKPTWTLFITGPKIRTWGFHCKKGFVPWYDFVDMKDRGSVGRGCGEDE